MVTMTAIIGWSGDAGLLAGWWSVSSGGVAFPPGTPEGQVCLQDSVLISSCSVSFALSLEQWASLVIPSRWYIQRPEGFGFLLTSHPLIFVSLAQVGASQSFILSRCSLHLTSPSLNPFPSCHTNTRLAEVGRQDLGRMTVGEANMAALRSHKKGGNRAAQTCRTHHRYPKGLEEGIAIRVLSCPGRYHPLLS